MTFQSTRISSKSALLDPYGKLVELYIPSRDTVIVR